MIDAPGKIRLQSMFGIMTQALSTLDSALVPSSLLAANGRIRLSGEALLMRYLMMDNALYSCLPKPYNRTGMWADDEVHHVHWSELLQSHHPALMRLRMGSSQQARAPTKPAKSCLLRKQIVADRELMIPAQTPVSIMHRVH